MTAAALDASRQAADHISTLLMVSRGEVASGTAARSDEPRRILGISVSRFQRRAPGHPLGDQLRRARLAAQDLDRAVAELAATATTWGPLDLVPEDAETIVSWTALSLDEAGTRTASTALDDARSRVSRLSSALGQLDGRLRLAITRSVERARAERDAPPPTT